MAMQTSMSTVIGLNIFLNDLKLLKRQHKILTDNIMFINIKGLYTVTIKKKKIDFFAFS